ncbi:MAG: hypothetical protein IJ679_04025 [Lachnospiraceae bacterium]|nr:hypothetical protein [Lachnospiraceae bacterium]
MIELQFDKGICEYEVQIQQITKANDTLPMKLDSGSPITIICIPYLLEVTSEHYSTLLLKIENAIAHNDYVSYHAYGSQEDDNGRNFIPYLATDITIGEQNLNYFLFWLDVTNYTKYEITTTLFGYDYIKETLIKAFPLRQIAARSAFLCDLCAWFMRKYD